MKLRNKITGEEKEVIVSGYPLSRETKMWECSEIDANEETGYKILGTYNSLAELNEEWEDVQEEPKEYWFIDADGSVQNTTGLINDYKSSLRNFGNYFETKEEAEQAVKKLKAWKRLNDKGFRITLNDYKGNAWLQANWGNLQGDYSDVLLLFGGEE